MSDAKKYWVGLNLVKGIGSVRFGSLLDYFGDAETAWNASPADLRETGLPAKIIETFLGKRSDTVLDQLWEKILNQNITVLTWDDETYPRRLKEINQPPPVIYVRGSLKIEDEWSIAVVGTRRVSPYGRQAAEEIASGLARNGLTVVSGLARGIDAIAHQTALKSGGRTIGVLGCGVDRIYPPEHRRLASQMIEQGAVISDYPLGTPPEGVNFPPRNRIISGLSMAVAIIEAGERSGALITASFAADQGRDVFALPGSIFSPQSAGTNRLIDTGAFPLLSIQSILDVLNLALVHEKQTASRVLPANEIEASLLEVLSHDPQHVDEIRNRSDLPIQKVTASLTLMELKGLVRQVGGMKYV
ncbi:MAG: DNA-processing protein DprA, partial [Anaerolineales bacterium]|nr:DNA-processing protein DprA [Anaerolineales bacterium]